MKWQKFVPWVLLLSSFAAACGGSDPVNDELEDLKNDAIDSAVATNAPSTKKLTLNPCELLSTAEVAEALGWEQYPSTLGSPSLEKYRTVQACTWGSPDNFYKFLLRVVTYPKSFTPQQITDTWDDETSSNWYPVSGLGDQAYGCCKGKNEEWLTIRKGNVSISIFVNDEKSKGALSPADTLATAAATRTPKALRSPAPSPTPANYHVALYLLATKALSRLGAN